MKRKKVTKKRSVKSRKRFATSSRTAQHRTPRRAAKCKTSSPVRKPLKKRPPRKPVAAKPVAPTSAATKTWPLFEERITSFELLPILRHILMAHDILFLSHQVAYHIAADAGLPKIWADPEALRLALSRIIEYIVRRSPRGSRIFINMKEFSFRGGIGVELHLSCTDRHLQPSDASTFLMRLFDEKLDPASGVSLAECRELIAHQHGQFWADLPKHNQPSYHLVLPTSEATAHLHLQGHQLFKYDVTIVNFPLVRKRFGIRKSESLITQVESLIRSLVRYPMDMVMAIPEQGVITTIYEAQQGAPESVVSRISHRLGREEFRIGSRPILLSFRYQLMPLTPPPCEEPEAAIPRNR
jgi:hypothetical protein